MGEANIDILIRVRKDPGTEAVFSGIRKSAQSTRSALAPSGDRGSILSPAKFAIAAQSVDQLTSAARRGITAPLVLAAGFEQGMAEVRAVTGDAQIIANFTKLEAKAREIGRDTEFTATEASQGLKFLGVAGRNTADQLASISPIMDASTVSGSKLGRTSDIVTDVMGGFGLESNKTRFAVDTMIATVLNANTSLDQLGRGLFKVGPLAKKVGIDLGEMSTILGVLANAGIKGAEGGTALRNIMLALAGKPTKDMRRALRKLGLSSKELRATLGREGLEGVLGQLATKTKDMSGPLQLFVSNILFGRRSSTAATEILSKLGTGYVDLKKKVDSSTGASKKAAAQFRSTSQAAGKQLRSALEDVGITIGNELLPVMLPLIADAKSAANEFSAWAQANPELVRTGGKVLLWITAVGTVLGPVLFSLASLGTLLSFAGPAAAIFATGAKGAIKGVLALGGGTQKLVGLLGSPAGLVALSAGAGISIGLWLDKTFKISDAMAGLNTEMIITNTLLEQQIGLQFGLSKVRGGAALLGDLTEQEQNQLASAIDKKESFGKDLSDLDTNLVQIALKRGKGSGQIEDFLRTGIQQQQGVIDRINKAGLKRKDRKIELAERQKALTTSPSIPSTSSSIGPSQVRSPPATPAINAQAQALLKQIRGESAKLQVIVSDDRVKVSKISGDMPVDVTQGVTT